MLSILFLGTVNLLENGLSLLRLSNFVMWDQNGFSFRLIVPGPEVMTLYIYSPCNASSAVSPGLETPGAALNLSGSPSSVSSAFLLSEL